MNSEEIKLTDYLHNIIENNMSLRKENERLWEQKLEYIDRISKVIEYLHETSEIGLGELSVYGDSVNPFELEKILKGEKE